jgi:transcription antitermination protein NusB
MLYAWEVQGRPPMAEVAHQVLHLAGPRERAGTGDRAEFLAGGVVLHVTDLDSEIAAAAEHWRLERIGAVERGILRLALYELTLDDAPPAVVIDEALRLAHWFAGPKAPAFINGVLDSVARSRGRL